MQSTQPSSERRASSVRPPSRNRSPPAKRQRTNPESYSSPQTPPSLSPPRLVSAAPTTGSYPAKWFRRPSVVWYRGNDLRVEDHPALLAAAQRGGPVVPFFVWDPSDGFGASLGHVKQWWLRESLIRLQHDLQRLGVQLYTRTGRSAQELRSFLIDTGADAVFWNRCYEPDLLTRDEKLRNELAQEGLTAESFKAELLVEPWELSNTQLAPCFSTFHDYMRAWMTLPPPPQPLPCPSRLQRIAIPVKSTPIVKLGFDIPSTVEDTLLKLWTPGSQHAQSQLDKFLREAFPAFGDGQCRRHLEGTSKLSPHVRFGELSPRRIYHTTRLRVWRWRDKSSSPPLRSASRGKSRGPMAASPNSRPNHSSSASTPVLEINSTDTHCKGNEKKVISSQGRKAQNRKVEDRIVQLGKVDMSRSLRSSPVPALVGLVGRARPRRLPPVSMSARAFLKNLCLRDFSYHVLFHNPDFNSLPLIPEFSHFPWAEDNGSFDSWRHGKTGYPIVDAAMRELRATGWIHNGLRFLLACFLTKYLLLPWARGLKEFYHLLIDGDRSANALGWQWTAGCNTDSFPVSCLVNPVKVALQHDPTGSYVRRWVPELAKVPTKYLHQPWKAPVSVLTEAGVEFGVNYPSRIIFVSEARRRALDAMRVMKQIFTDSNIARAICNCKDDELVTEWPSEETEMVSLDEAPLVGKKGLVPSLWALLEHPSSCLSTSLSGSDFPIAMDTANLAEGALAMPLDENQESIEHALITGHESCSSLPGGAESSPAGEGAFDLYSEKKNHDSRTILGTDIGNEDNVEQLEESLKYGSGESPLFSQPDKRPQQSSVLSREESSVRPDPLQVSQGAGHRPADRPHHNNIGSSQVPDPHAVIHSTMPSAYQHQSHQHIPNLQRLHLQQFHQFQHFQQLQQQQQLQLGDQHHFRQHNQQGIHSIRSQQNTPQNLVHSVMEGGYAGGVVNPALPNAVAGVAMNPSGVMMGATTNTSDVGGNQVIPSNDIGNGIFTPQFGMSPLYAYPSIVPVVHPHTMSGAESTEVTGGPSNGGRGKMSLPGILPIGYDLYGAGGFDTAAAGSSLPSDGAPYRSLSVSSQRQNHVGSQPHYGFSPHPVYLPQSHSSSAHARGGADSTSPGALLAGGSPLGEFGLVSEPASAVAAVAAAAAVAAGGREVAAGGREAAATAAPSSQYPKALPENQSTDRKPGPLSPKHLSTDTEDKKAPKSSNGSSANHADLAGRSNTKSASRSKVTTRNRRGIHSSVGPRNRTYAVGTNSRGRISDKGASISHQRIQGDNISPPITTLEARQKLLSSVLENKDHEYYNFANFLARTCELTGNTDRQTSKDYIRLCNLKDDFHKQCSSEEEKLKIYRIKKFFSMILKLEVTGEWDRHNHGGVRGPYVYGIRMRKPQDSYDDSVPN